MGKRGKMKRGKTKARRNDGTGEMVAIRNSGNGGKTNWVENEAKRNKGKMGASKFKGETGKKRGKLKLGKRGARSNGDNGGKQK